MSTRRFPWVRSLALGVALTVAAAVPHARAAAPGSDFEQLIAEADAHVGQGRHDEALRAYAEAFRAMPLELQVSGVGELVALGAAKAALDDYEVRGEQRSLEQAREIVDAFVTAATQADPALAPAPTETASQRLAELDALLSEPEANATEPPPPVDELAPASPTEPAPASPSPTEPDAPPDRSRLGLGLAVGGGVAVLAGVGLMIAGARQVPWLENELEAEGWQPTDEGYDAQIADAERVRALDLGLGAGALVIGVGLGITGAVLMARSKRSRGSDLALVPMLGRNRAGLGAVVRF